MDLYSRKSFFSKNRFRINSNEIRAKLSRDRIHHLFKEVDNYYHKLSPSNCSKNLLAINSNLDTEIESAKHLAHLPAIIASRSQNASLSPSKRKLNLPYLTNTPSRLMEIKNESFSELSRYSNMKISLMNKKLQSGRLTKINKIIYNCSGLKERFLDEKNKIKYEIPAEAQIEVEESLNNKDGKVNDFEKNIIERCKRHFEDLDMDEEDEVKLTQALKRGKKIWKQNHFAFIKNIDKSLRGLDQP